LEKTLSRELLEVLACPKCHGPLKYEKPKNKLFCKKCKKEYLIEEGIPLLLP